MNFLLFSLGLLAFAVLGDAFLLGTSQGAIRQTSGANQPGNCGSNPARICMPNDGRCRNDECECKNGLVGDGTNVCHHPDAISCCIKSDPSVTTTKGEFFHFPFPCRARFAQYSTAFPNYRDWETATNGFTCFVRVHTYQERVQGKFFSGGFDVYLRFRKGTNEEIIRFRGHGEVNPATNKYRFQTLAKVDDGNWGNTQSNNPPTASLVNFFFGRVNTHKTIELNVRKCGLNLEYRPVHPDQGKDQARVPGVCITIDPRDCGMINYDEGSMCSGPTMMDMSMMQQAAALKVGTREEAAIQLALRQTNQFPNYIPDTCRDLPQVLDDCPEARNTLASAACLELLNVTANVRCVSKATSTDTDDKTDASVIMDLYHMCYKSICEADIPLCKNVRTTMLADDKCSQDVVDDIPLSDAFCDALV